MKNRLLLNVAHLSLANAIAQLVGVARGILAARFLGPELMGIWAAVYVYYMYAGNLHFGIYNSLSRDIPIFRGGGNPQSAKHYLNNAFSYTVLSSVFVLVLMGTASFALPSTNSQWALGMKLMVLLAAVQQWICFYRFVLVAENEFRRYSILTAVYSVLSLSAVFLTPKYGFAGYMVGFLAADSVYAVFLARSYRLRFSFRLEPKVLLSMMKTGFPIYLVGALYVVLQSTNRIVASRLLGPVALGQFSLGLMGFNLVYFIPESLRQVIYVKMGETYGKSGGEIKDLGRYTIMVSRWLSIVMPLVVFLFIVGMVVLVPIVLPEYVDGLAPAIVYVAATLFLGFASIYANLLNILMRQAVLAAAQGAAILLNVVCGFLLVRAGFGLMGLSIASAVAYLTYFVVLGVAAMGAASLSATEKARTFGEMLLPGVFLAAVLVALSRLLSIRVSRALLSPGYLTTIILVLCCVISYTTVMYLWVGRDGSMTSFVRKETT